MLDKIRLNAAGKLPADYVTNLGETRPGQFDARCCRFLGVAYADVASRVRAGATDGEVLAWVEAHGTRRTDEECTIWNQFMMKLGWRDEATPRLQARVREYGLEGKPIETFFDLFEYDEGRDPMRAQPWSLRPRMIVLLMGVAGSGKTTIGQALAAELGWRFNDADEFHPAANVAKMSAGIPLDDADREPWLAAIRAHLERCLERDQSAVVTCSALKNRYREKLLFSPAVKLVYLRGTPELLQQRIAGRKDHFMKPEMLASQLAALEEPENALVVDIAAPPAEIVAKIAAAVR